MGKTRYHNFYKDRAAVLKKENSQYLGADLILSSSETAANDFLMRHKYKEVLSVFDDSNTTNISQTSVFPPSQNFVITKHLILDSNVYKFIANLPKGEQNL